MQRVTPYHIVSSAKFIFVLLSSPFVYTSSTFIFPSSIYALFHLYGIYVLGQSFSLIFPQFVFFSEAFLLWYFCLAPFWSLNTPFTLNSYLFSLPSLFSFKTLLHFCLTPLWSLHTPFTQNSSLSSLPLFPLLIQNITLLSFLSHGGQDFYLILLPSSMISCRVTWSLIYILGLWFWRG